MKAVIWRGDRRLDVEDVPEPVPADDEVVLAVELAGICGSDLHAFRGHPGPRTPPLVLGHEVVGVSEGRLFTVYPLVSCGGCERCAAGEDNLCDTWQLIGLHRPGVFAEHVVVPRHALVPVPAGTEEACAVLTEPLACCVAALRPHDVDANSRVLVMGCGPIGLLTVFLAARRGAEVVAVDPLPERRAIATRLGASRVVAEGSLVECGFADVAVDAAGFETTLQGCVDAVRAGGAVVLVGLGQSEALVPTARVVRRCITMRGQFAYSRDDFISALDVLRDGDLDRSWISTEWLHEAPRAFADLADRPARSIKTLLVSSARTPHS
jgi:threonine dehydrogenase-like Zn-dependent dehydrogenase